MNKEQYLQKLRESLSGLRAEDAAEIMQYYTEYFEDAGPEHEAAVIGELGDPAVLAAQAMEALGQTQEAGRNASRPLLLSLLGLLKGRSAAQEDPQSAYRFQEMDLEPFRSVFVHVRNCSISIKESAGGRYGADVCLLLNEGETAQAGIENGAFTVRIDGRALSHRNLQGNQYVKLYLPAAEYERIELHSSNAPVISDCPAAVRSELKMDTSNSPVNVSGIRDAGKIHADTSNGSIHFRSLKGTELVADTSNGSIRIEDAFCDVCITDTSNASISVKSSVFRKCTADTSNGGITVSGCRFTEELKADTSNAPITAELEGSESDYRVSADTSNAAIYVNGEKRGKSCSVGYGTRKVVLDTSNGRINITYKPALSADTKA